MAQSELTVYNTDLAVVKEVRRIKMSAGEQLVSVTDVASAIDPTSVGFRSLNSADSFQVLDQNYQYDLISPLAILRKSIGMKIRLIRHFGTATETLTGTLLSVPNSTAPSATGQTSYDGMVIRADDGQIILNPVGEVTVESVPEGLISTPTLLWTIDSTKAQDADVELSYLTHGLAWNADYVLTLDGPSQTADLHAWVTLTNNSGKSYNGVKLKLLAGNINRASEPPAATVRSMAKMDAATATEETLFEYHLYTMSRPAFVKDHEIKQLSLFEGSKVPYQKRIIFDSLSRFGQYYPQENSIGEGTIHGTVKIEFVNDAVNHLGMALPAGRFRISQRDASGSIQLLGEDNIDHTPKNERVSLTVGTAFDVVANRKRTSFHRISGREVEETYEMEVRNRKDTSETVELLERHYGDWHIPQSSEKFEKPDANTQHYTLILKPNEVRKVTYRVRTQW